MRITDQKCEGETPQHSTRDHCRIAWLRWRAVWEWPWFLDGGRRVLPGMAVAVDDTVALCADPSLLEHQGRRDLCRLCVGRQQIVDDVLDKDSFPLWQL